MNEIVAGKRTRVTSPDVVEPTEGLWSNCFKIDNLLVVAGMVGKDQNGELGPLGDPYKQAVIAFSNMKSLVEAGGGKVSDIVKLNCYLTDMRHRDAFIKARREFFTDDFPPCVVIGNVTFADAKLLVEIDATAIIGSGD